MVEKSTKSGLSAYEKPHPSRIGLVFGHDPIPMTQIHCLNFKPTHSFFKD